MVSHICGPGPENLKGTNPRVGTSTWFGHDARCRGRTRTEAGPGSGRRRCGYLISGLIRSVASFPKCRALQQCVKDALKRDYATRPRCTPCRPKATARGVSPRTRGKACWSSHSYHQIEWSGISYVLVLECGPLLPTVEQPPTLPRIRRRLKQAAGAAAAPALLD